MNETFEQAVDKSKENYALLISGIDNMNLKKTEADGNINSLFQDIFGGSDGLGILGFYEKVVEYTSPLLSGATLIGKSNPSSSDFKSRLIGNNSSGLYQGGIGGLDGEFFPDDSNGNETDFDINLNVPMIYRSEYQAGTDSSFAPSESVVNSVLTAVQTQQGDSSSGFYYSYTEAQKQQVDDAITLLLAYPSKIDPIITNLSGLKQNTENHLKSVLSLEDASVLEIPDLSSLISALNTIKGVNTGWTSQLEDIKTRFDAIATYASAISYNSTLVNILNELKTLISNTEAQYSSGISSLKTAIEQDALQCSSSYSNVQGFRKHWVYWILKAIDRPNSYRMDYNGAVQAISSLEGQKTSARYAVSLVADPYVYLPTPVLNCLYFDADIGLYSFVFTAIPCFDSVELKIGDSSVVIQKSSIINNSEFTYDLTGTADDTAISIRLKKGEETSEFSNTISILNPSYTA